MEAEPSKSPPEWDERAPLLATNASTRALYYGSDPDSGYSALASDAGRDDAVHGSLGSSVEPWESTSGRARFVRAGAASEDGSGGSSLDAERDGSCCCRGDGQAQFDLDGTALGRTCKYLKFVAPGRGSKLLDADAMEAGLIAEGDRITEFQGGEDGGASVYDQCPMVCIACFLRRWLVEPVIQELARWKPIERRILGCLWVAVLLCVLAAVYYWVQLVQERSLG